MPKTSTAVACQPSEMLPLDAVSPPDVSPSDKSTDGISSAAESPCEVPLDAKSPVCRQELLHSAPTPVAQSRLTTPGLDKTLDTVHTREDAHRTLPAQNQLPLHVPREASYQTNPNGGTQASHTSDNYSYYYCYA